jgi:hypothetical protein
VETYKLAIEKLENQSYKTQMREFQKDHERHITDLSQVLANTNDEAKCPNHKQWLVKMLISLGDILKNDAGVLKIMSYVEKDTNTAYERYVNYNDIEEVDIRILQQGLMDEKKHKNWIDTTLNSI